jgi:hypothetical protein
MRCDCIFISILMTCYQLILDPGPV